MKTGMYGDIDYEWELSPGTKSGARPGGGRRRLRQVLGRALGRARADGAFARC